MLIRDDVFIGGKWVPAGGGRRDIVNPATEEVVARVRDGAAADARHAVEAAREAFESWSSTPLGQRLAVLRRALAIFGKRGEELARTVTAEVGTPITAARTTSVGGAERLLAETVDIAGGYTFETRDGPSLIRREPVGVVAAISPWNQPLYLAMVKIAPALAAGCTVVHKPGESSPLSAYLLTEILDAAGVPAGVFNMVPGTGAEVGEVLDTHPAVDMVDFTGSTAAGRRVAELAALTLKRLVLELGGKSAAVLLDDADLEHAVSESVHSCLNNAGQMCGAWTRMLVPRNRIDEATDLAVAAVAQYRQGDPADESTTLGPLANAAQYDRVRDYIRAGLREDATLVTGGLDRPPTLDRGYYVRPTVFTHVRNDMRIAREEIFGPVLSLIPHDGDDDAVALANDSDYGLRGAVFSADPDRALAVARRLRTGQVDINAYKMNPRAPFGGFKQSGLGRCQGIPGFEEFLELKAIQL
ncbi:aldehyde dehydrogenase family protein [Nocardia sp. CDC160]|uniref:aldehyde dehydrogenase family protein n=1 Tax=Nocardia sp. CDC160 TaxID=3112166 RepID=UPI002DC04EA1|nr:aldehyde dehydrogenase family protein [Nocardia sp. CDC160]MEC3919890.1 aldehyde dehydrogenase family protein [Nocardia sp. CDC160]